ncbi:MAG: hypothetical protein BWK73_29850 [Thiothrix lacustris]|uniref:ATPase dynein-related AAA domain-containing protein n=1 Tax=Thiothrix lacustris TaxID=525917 RepID=A0A1Y1QJ30_9GAMM|nr:MAG: hypothetical protein BWK73_29850 [Thiothrix lacustris]
MTSCLQKILFGGPGVGKSHKIKKILEELGIDNSSNYVKTVFHPEYTYGDFMGKLLPLTIKEKVEYKFYAGYFLEVLAKAYKNILLNPISPEPVALVIDEINRGNSSAIFGTIFQLLDREHDDEYEGWSCYETKLSEMEYFKLLELIGIKHDHSKNTYSIKEAELEKSITGNKIFYETQMQEFHEKILNPIRIKDKSIRIPPNMSIIATMNTSDNSIFYMDSAFKRRWDWEFIRGERQEATIDGKHDWSSFVDNLNRFFVDNSKFIRQIEDKQIGYWFITSKSKKITTNDIRNKLLFFIWDSVFSRDKEGLKQLIGEKNDLITFNQFSDQCENFIEKIINYQPKTR